MKVKSTNHAVRSEIREYTDNSVLVYRLFADKAGKGEENIGDGVIYSLTVSKFDRRGKCMEVCRLRDVTRKFSTAEKLLKALSDFLVPPCTAAEIVSDIIGAQLI